MRWVFRVSAALFAIAILLLSLEPAGDFTGTPHIDKVQHFLAYGTLCGLIILGWKQWRVARIVIGVAIYGICIEMAQGMTDLGRTPSILDAIANLAGAATVGFLLQLLGQSARK